MTNCRVCDLHGDYENEATTEVLMGFHIDDPGEMTPVCEWHKAWADKRATQTPREEPWWRWRCGVDGESTDPAHPWNRAPAKAPVAPLKGNDGEPA